MSPRGRGTRQFLVPFSTQTPIHTSPAYKANSRIRSSLHFASVTAFNCFALLKQTYSLGERRFHIKLDQQCYFSNEDTSQLNAQFYQLTGRAAI